MGLVEVFSIIAGLRVKWRSAHDLVEMLMAVVYGMLCGAANFVNAWTRAEWRVGWRRPFLRLDK